MYQVILFFHVLIAVCLVGLVLIQQGKGAEMGASFGSGASNTVFGSQGIGSFLFKATATMVALFFLTSLILSSIITFQYRMAQKSLLPGGIVGSKVSLPIPKDK